MGLKAGAGVGRFAKLLISDFDSVKRVQDYDPA